MGVNFGRGERTSARGRKRYSASGTERQVLTNAVLTVLCRMFFFFDNPTQGREITEYAALSGPLNVL
jgi:hypothetical protein